jgi:hypothetical protein
MNLLLPCEEIKFQKTCDKKTKNYNQDAAYYPYPVLILKENPAHSRRGCPKECKDKGKPQYKDKRICYSEKSHPNPVYITSKVFKRHACYE